jgi:hypothetical protein
VKVTPADLVALHLDPNAVHVPDIGKARKRLTLGSQLENAPTAVPFSARGGGEFPPSRARQSSAVAAARRIAVYTPFSPEPVLAGQAALVPLGWKLGWR